MKLPSYFSLMKNKQLPEDVGLGWQIVGGALTVLCVLLIVVTATVGWSWVTATGAPEWVQAIGSIVGLAIAIMVPARMHALAARERREKERARAYVTATSMIFMCNSFLGALHALRFESHHAVRTRFIERKHYQIPHEKLLATFRAIQLPSEAQLHDLTSASAQIAKTMTRGFSLVVQLKALLETNDFSRDDELGFDAKQALDRVTGDTIVRLEEARALTIDFVNAEDARVATTKG